MCVHERVLYLTFLPKFETQSKSKSNTTVTKSPQTHRDKPKALSTLNHYPVSPGTFRNKPVSVQFTKIYIYKYFSGLKCIP